VSSVTEMVLDSELDIPRFIFVTGASRSGTTMLSRILGNADNCVSLNELHFFGELVPVAEKPVILSRDQACFAVAMTLARHARDVWVREPSRSEWAEAQRIVNSLPEGRLTGDAVFAAMMKVIAAKAGASHICEQTPRNIFYAHYLLNAFPNADVVHVVRDPRAVMASQKSRYRVRRLGGRNVPIREVIRLWLNYHPVTMVRLWRSATREAQILADTRRFTIVRYEDLITQPVQTVSAVCQRLGIVFQEKILEVPHWGSSTVVHPSRSGISGASLDKWRTMLTTTEIAYCESATKQERESFGYDALEGCKPTIFGIVKFVLRFPVHVLGVVLANPRRMLVQIRAMFRSKAGN